ncbi:MAG: glycosyltransferase family 2 protein [Candidatus Obscuribacterales bacterium]|nr:glycosyltransferase family 2 protein [Candidatus Obscuribacterales bacterium]
MSRCLQSIAWAEQIFVVDSHSTDQTCNIADSFGAQVAQFEFNGVWPKKKNWALDNLPIKHQWVFILDADEVMPPQSEAEFRKIVEAESSEFDGYLINRRFHFMGKWLKHAYFPNWNLRLFKHSAGRYEKLTDSPTSSGDNEVHEHIIVNGKVGHLESIMDHYAFPTVEVFVEKHNRYSSWEARVALDNYTASSTHLANMPTIRLRRQLKTLSQKLPFRPLLKFLYIYVWEKAFLDGPEGYYFARLHGFHEFLIVAKTTELRNSRKAR